MSRPQSSVRVTPTTEVVLKLWSLAAGRCSYAPCRIECFIADVKVGERAHIIAASTAGPRGNAPLGRSERASYDNLILLCPTHHTLVDGDPIAYPADMLRGWKTHHENWVRAQLSQSVSGVGFAELEVVCKALLATTPLASSALIAIPPSHKVAANGLTAAAESHLRIGLMQAPEVADFLDRFVSTDSDFGNRLRAGFVSEYERLYQARYRGDALFFALLDAVSSRTDSPQIRRAAALAVLAHLFQLCEVFSS